uniref:Uncharacterized protein n=1 Tax=Salmonella sp. TaxID=599 RepID=A0A482EUG6_SALSP|nr:hypothetical protein NNIBIDOC_00145 [Salmonella sp.]
MEASININVLWINRLRLIACFLWLFFDCTGMLVQPQLAVVLLSERHSKLVELGFPLTYFILRPTLYCESRAIS